MFKNYLVRKYLNKFFLGGISVAGLIILSPLLFIFSYLIINGIDKFSLDFFTQLPKGPGESGGGMLHAITGTIYMVGLSGLIAIPWGLFVGIYLSEYSKTLGARIVRFVCDLLNGVPSIVFGIFVYALMVKAMKSFSALAGGVALAVVILPIIARSVEEILKLVPNTVRHAGLGLGLPRWKVIFFIVVWGSRANLLPGILLALARSMGETAPLLFTAFGSMYLSFSLTGPMASLPVEIYNYAISPYTEWQNLAWTGGLVLIVLVFVLNITSKYFFTMRVESYSKK